MSKSLATLEKELSILSQYKFYIDTIFEEISDQLDSIEKLHLYAISQYYDSNTDNNLTQIESLYDFKIIKILYDLFRSNNRIVNVALKEIEMLYNKNYLIFREYRFSLEIKAGSIFNNRKLLEVILNNIEFEISLKKEKNKK